MVSREHSNGNTRRAARRAATGVLLSGLLAIAGPPPLPAQTPGAPEAREFSDEQVKAALVLHFLNKTEWPAGSPPEPKGAVTVGVVAAPAFARYLRALTEGGHGAGTPREVTVVELGDNDDPAACRVVYFGQNDRPARGILARLADRPVLTIGEGREFTRAGGIFGFERHQRKIRYWFSPDAMGRSNLKIHPDVTRLQLKPDRKQAGE